jgi:Zn-dependent peptidase ImmA (M78 family)
MIDDLPRDEVIAAVDQAVEELLDKAGIVVPPVDAIVLAQKHLGMVVCLDRQQRQRGRAQRAAGVRQIYLRPEPSEERHQWTVAHEIGEHLKADLLQRLGIVPGETPAMAGESLANLFAHRLLVPSRWFTEDASEQEYDLLELKRRYQTASHEVIAWRLLDLPEPCVVTIVDNDQISRRRSNSWPVRSRRLEPAEQQCQRRIHTSGRPQSLRQGDWAVQGWPVHRADWKREILRSVRDGDC